MELKTCEVCGSPVEVVTSDEGTCFYKPIAPPLLTRLQGEKITELQKALDDIYAEASRMAKAHRHYLDLNANQAAHVGNIIRTVLRVYPKAKELDKDAGVAN